jgi:hypothetical protein
LSDTGAVKNISLSKIVKCPHEWDGTVSRREFPAVQTWKERQEDSNLKKVRKWNSRKTGPKTRSAFLRFLGFSV